MSCAVDVIYGNQQIDIGDKLFQLTLYQSFQCLRLYTFGRCMWTLLSIEVCWSLSQVYSAIDLIGRTCGR